MSNCRVKQEKMQKVTEEQKPILSPQEEKELRKRQEREEKRRRKLLKEGLLDGKSADEIRREMRQTNEDSVSNQPTRKKTARERMKDILNQ